MAVANRPPFHAAICPTFIRIVDVDKTQHWNSRSHFFSAVAEAIRKILVDCARRKEALKEACLPLGRLQPNGIAAIKMLKQVRAGTPFAPASFP